MRHIATVIFIVVGIINLVPVVGVMGAERLESLYGTRIGDADLLLLMRHRAVLLGIVGSLIIGAAFRDRWRGVATVAGLVSMGSFVLLAIAPTAHGEALQRVFWIDVIACVLLGAGYWVARRTISS
jgi:hypothetical protein